MRLIYHPGSERDIEEAGLFYAEQSPVAARRFAEQLAATLGEIRSAPNLGQRFGKSIRCRSMGRFPFAIYYRVNGEELFIFAVKHHSRDHQYWRDRLDG